MIKKELKNAVLSIPFYYTKIFLESFFKIKVLPINIYKNYSENAISNINQVNIPALNTFRHEFNINYWNFKNVRVIGQEGLSVINRSIIVNGYYSNSVKNGRLKKVGPFSIKYHANYMLQSFRLPKTKNTLSKAIIITSIWSENYYHWFMEVLPRILLYEILEIPSIMIVVNRLNGQFQKSSLKYFDQKIKFIETSKNNYIQIDEAFIPFSTTIEVWKLNFLRQRFQKLMVESESKRIYISRCLTNTRSVLNEKKLLNFLGKYKFEKVILENMNFEDQVKMFYNAKIIIAPHGAGLTNLIFSQKHTKVIELFTKKRIVNVYKTISDLLSLEYYRIIDKSKYLYNPKKNIKVNYRELNKLLESLLWAKKINFKSFN